MRLSVTRIAGSLYVNLSLTFPVLFILLFLVQEETFQISLPLHSWWTGVKMFMYPAGEVLLIKAQDIRMQEQEVCRLLRMRRPTPGVLPRRERECSSRRGRVSAVSGMRSRFARSWSRAGRQSRCRQNRGGASTWSSKR